MQILMKIFLNPVMNYMMPEILDASSDSEIYSDIYSYDSSDKYADIYSGINADKYADIYSYENIDES